MKKIIPAVLVVIVIVVVAIVVMLNNANKETIINTSGEIIEKIENTFGEENKEEEVEYNPQYDTLDEYLNDTKWLSKLYIPYYAMRNDLYSTYDWDYEYLTKPQIVSYVKAANDIALVKVHVLEEEVRDEYYIVGLENGKIKIAKIPEDYDCIKLPEQVGIKLCYDKSNNVFKYILEGEDYYYEDIFTLDGFNVNIISQGNSLPSGDYHFEDIDSNQCEIENPYPLRYSKEGRYIGENFEGKYFWKYDNLIRYINETTKDDYTDFINKNRNNLKDFAASHVNYSYEHYNGERALDDSLIDDILERDGDSAGYIEQITNYDSALPVNWKVDFKFAAILYNLPFYMENLIVNGKNSNTYKGYKETIEKYKNGTLGNDEEQEFYKNFDLEKFMQDIANDKKLNDLRKRIKTDEYSGFTFEEEAYCTAVYSDLFQYMPPNPSEKYYKVFSITFMNGKSDSIDDYYDNARAKKIKIKINDWEKEIILKDTPEYQNVWINWESKGDEYQKPVTVSIEVLEKYDGDITDDVYFSGININKDQNFVSFAI